VKAAVMPSKLGEHAAAAVPALRAALQDPDVHVRRKALEALGKLGIHEAAAVHTLEAALKVSDWHTRAKAAEMLGKLGHSALPCRILTAMCAVRRRRRSSKLGSRRHQRWLHSR